MTSFANFYAQYSAMINSNTKAAQATLSQGGPISGGSITAVPNTGIWSNPGNITPQPNIYPGNNSPYYPYPGVVGGGGGGAAGGWSATLTPPFEPTPVIKPEDVSSKVDFSSILSFITILKDYVDTPIWGFMLCLIGPENALTDLEFKGLSVLKNKLIENDIGCIGSSDIILLRKIANILEVFRALNDKLYEELAKLRANFAVKMAADIESSQDTNTKPFPYLTDYGQFAIDEFIKQFGLEEE